MNIRIKNEESHRVYDLKTVKTDMMHCKVCDLALSSRSEKEFCFCDTFPPILGNNAPADICSNVAPKTVWKEVNYFKEKLRERRKDEDNKMDENV